MRITNSEKALAEHYLYTTAAAAVALYQTGNHNLKHVAFAAVIGVIGPVIAKFNPRSTVTKLAKTEHLDAATTAALAAVAVSATKVAQKDVAQAAVDLNK